MQRFAILAVAFITTGVAFAQTAQAPAPTYEVASIKPAAPGQIGRFIRPTPGGRLNANNITLKDLIQIAYRIQSFQVTGGPAWLGSDGFDIIAKAEGDPPLNQFPELLRPLLADRFALKFHRETKDLPVYALVAPNDKGKATPSLALAKEGACTVRDPTKPPPGPGEPPTLYCGNIYGGFKELHGQAVTLANLVPILSRMLGRTVIDKTGMTAKYDINLEWTPDQSQLSLMQLPPDVPMPAFDPNGPSIFTAFPEQLGLKLESQKGPVEVFVVDHAEKPSEN